jgi:hypothetical protein
MASHPRPSPFSRDNRDEVGLLAAALCVGDHATAVHLFPQAISAVLLDAADAALEAPAIGGAEAPV